MPMLEAPHVLESSGIIDASAWLGAGTWLFDVQRTRPVRRLAF